MYHGDALVGVCGVAMKRRPNERLVATYDHCCRIVASRGCRGSAIRHMVKMANAGASAQWYVMKESGKTAWHSTGRASVAATSELAAGAIQEGRTEEPC
jgi:hypothetical protein